MTSTEFIEKYDMHDSLLEAVSVSPNGSRITLSIDFAFWRQKGYKETEPETGLLMVVFLNVTRYEIPDNVDWSMCSILNTEADMGGVKFLLNNEMTDDYLEMYIMSNDIRV